MKIFTATPRAFLTEKDDDDSFFSRDMGLTCHALQKAGVDSKVVLLDGSDVKLHPDIVRASLEQMESDKWWAQFKLDAVVLCAWVAPRYTPIAKAIKESGAKLIVRCDSGEPYSQWQKTVGQSFYTHYLAARYKGKGWLYACGFSLLKTLLFYIPAVYEDRIVKHLSYADLILNETPEGVRLLKALLVKKGRDDIAVRVQCVPHPVVDGVGYSEKIKKEKRIISVGRWDNYQKNTPLLIRTLKNVLAKHTDYDAHLFGGGEDVLRKRMSRLPEDIRSRIIVRGKVDHAALIPEYQKSRILFMPSRSEACSVAAEEALVCGCSIVGGRHIFCLQNFVSKDGGTLASEYSVNGLTEALSAEIQRWESGSFSAAQSGRLWKEAVAASVIAQAILRAVVNSSSI